ncbi:MAG: hypothetical protein VCD33_09755 [Alphaproteobacteria bacterium]
MISKILVPVRGDDKGENILAHAMVLAARYGAHVQVPIAARARKI